VKLRVTRLPLLKDCCRMTDPFSPALGLTGLSAFVDEQQGMIRN